MSDKNTHALLPSERWRHPCFCCPKCASPSNGQLPYGIFPLTANAIMSSQQPVADTAGQGPPRLHSDAQMSLREMFSSLWHVSGLQVQGAS